MNAECALVEQEQTTDNEITHLVCWCNTRIAMCGFMTDGVLVEVEDNVCVVCEDLEENDQPCPVCGLANDEAWALYGGDDE